MLGFRSEKWSLSIGVILNGNNKLTYFSISHSNCGLRSNEIIRDEISVLTSIKLRSCMVIIQMVITELVFLQGQTPKVNTFLQLGSVE